MNLSRKRTALASFQSVENFDDGMSMLVEIFLGKLDLHLCSMFLETQLGVFLKPPGGNLAFADSTQYWSGCNGFVGVGVGSSFSQKR